MAFDQTTTILNIVNESMRNKKKNPLLGVHILSIRIEFDDKNHPDQKKKKNQ